MSDVGKRIRSLREDRGITQEELALAVGYKSRASINKIELGRDIPIKKVREIATVLKTNPEYLLGWDDIDWNPDTQEISIDDSIMDKKYNQLIERMKSNKDFEEIIFEYAEMMYKRFEKED